MLSLLPRREHFCHGMLCSNLNTISALGEGIGISFQSKGIVQLLKKAFESCKILTATQLGQLLKGCLNSVMSIFEIASVLSTHYLSQNIIMELFGVTEILFLNCQSSQNSN